MFSAVFDLNKLDGTNGFTVLGIDQGSEEGYSVRSAGDINGDGLDDLLIGAPLMNSAQGASYVIFGRKNGFPASFNLTTLNGNNGFTIPGIITRGLLGISVSTAGDMNGDGLDDIIIGTSLIGSVQPVVVSYIIFGKKDGFPASFDLTTLNGTNGFTVPGLYATDTRGVFVSTAGDMNGDGLDDIVLGEPFFAAGNGNGASHVIFGRRNGFPASFNLTSLNGSNGFSVPGLVGLGGSLGASVSTAGDINGDGLDDLVLGAPSTINHINQRIGASYIIFGQDDFPPSFSLTSLNGSNGFNVTGIINAGDYSTLGASVSSAGDINGDGIDDIMLGAPFNYNFMGAAYIIFGQRNSFPASFDLNKLNGTNGFAVPGLIVPGSGLLGASVSTAGDINSDGIDDMVLGAATLANINAPGASYIIFGQRNSFPRSFNLTTLNGTNGFTVPGISAYGQLGASVSTAGDINGDGIDDSILGAPQGGQGASYIIFGRSTSSPTLGANNLLALQGKTVNLTSANLNATDLHTPSPELLFIAYNIAHGQFEYVDNPQVEIRQFSQHDVSASLVQFRTNNTSIAPAYDISVQNNRNLTTGPYPAAIIFHDAPVLVNNSLLVSNGTSVILSSADLRATEQYRSSQDLLFIVSNIEHGQFHLVNPAKGYVLLNSGISQFYQQNITHGSVQFTHDGSNLTPSYEVMVSDGILSSPSMPAHIRFHDAPVLMNNRLSIDQGQSVNLASGDLSATEHYTSEENLVFILSDIQHGQFQFSNTTERGITQFTQQNITQGIVQFTQDGSVNAPCYKVLVSDGNLTSSTPAPANIQFKRIGGNSNPESLVDKMGGWGGIAGIIIGGIIFVCAMSILSGIGVWRYFKSRKPRMINVTKFPDSDCNDATEISSVVKDAERQPFLQAYEQNNLDPIEALPVGDAVSKELNDSAANESLYPLSLHQETRQEYSSLSENSPKVGRFHGGMFNQKPASTPSDVKMAQQQEKVQAVQL